MYMTAGFCEDSVDPQGTTDHSSKTTGLKPNQEALFSPSQLTLKKLFTSNRLLLVVVIDRHY